MTKIKLLGVFVLVLLISFPTFSSLLRPGFFPMHDDMQVMRVYQMKQCLLDLQIPCRWVPDMGYGFGYPQFNYYGPLPYYLMATINLLGANLLDAVKIGFILSLVLGNFAILLASTSFFGIAGGLVSTFLYAYNPYRASDIYSRGAMSESWAFVFAPLILYFLNKTITSRRPLHPILLSFSVAGLFLTHNISSLIFLPLSIIFLLVLNQLHHGPKLKNLAKVGFSYLYGLLLAAFFVLPAFLEKKFAHTESMLGGYFDYRIHFVALKQIFLTTFWGFGSSVAGPNDDLSFFLGPILILFLLLAVFTIFRNFKSHRKQSVVAVTFIILGLVSTFMTHEKSSPIWSKLPLLAYLQFPWRFLVNSNLFYSLAAGVSLYNSKINKPVFISVVLLLAFIFNQAFFRPQTWIDITEQEKISGNLWDRQKTISIFDYLPQTISLPPTFPAPSVPGLNQSNFNPLNLKRGSDWISFSYIQEKPASQQLPIINFPGWKVFVDHKQVQVSNNNIDGLITFEAPSGSHFVEAKLTDTNLRLVSNLISLFSFILIIIFAFRKTTNE